MTTNSAVTSAGTLVKETDAEEVQNFLDDLNPGTVLTKEEKSTQEEDDVQPEDGTDEEDSTDGADSTDGDDEGEETVEEEEEDEEEAGDDDEEDGESASLEDRLAAALEVINSLSKTEDLDPLDLPGEEPITPTTAPELQGLVDISEDQLEEITRDPKVFKEYMSAVANIAVQNAVLQSTQHSRVQSSEDRLFTQFFSANADLAPVADLVKSMYQLAKQRSPTATPTTALDAAATSVRAKLKLSASIQEAGDSKNIKRKKPKGPSKGRHAQRGGNSKSVKNVKSAEVVKKTEVDLLQDELEILHKAGRP